MPTARGTQRGGFSRARQPLAPQRHRRRVSRGHRTRAVGNSDRELVFFSGSRVPPGADGSSGPRRACRSCCSRARVEYRLLHYASRALYGALLDAGMEIHEYHKSFLHAKVAVVDRRWATVGSSNIDPLSLLLAREANVVVDDAAFAASLHASLSAAMADGAREVRAEHWHRRPLPARVAHWACYGFARLLTGCRPTDRSEELRPDLRRRGKAAPAAASIWSGGGSGSIGAAFVAARGRSLRVGTSVASHTEAEGKALFSLRSLVPLRGGRELWPADRIGGAMSSRITADSPLPPRLTEWRVVPMLLPYRAGIQVACRDRARVPRDREARQRRRAARAEGNRRRAHARPGDGRAAACAAGRIRAASPFHHAFRRAARPRFRARCTKRACGASR